MQIRCRDLVCVLVAGASCAAFAHHSVDAAFETNSPFELEAVIVGSIWVNPHAYLLVDVTGSGTGPERWAVELSSPNSLARSGVDRDTFAAGASVSLSAYRQKPGINPVAYASDYVDEGAGISLRGVYDLAVAGRLLHGLKVTLPDGTTIEGNGIWWSDLTPQ